MEKVIFPIGVLVVVIVMSFALLGVTEFKFIARNYGLIADCEQSLPRTQHCVLKAVPDIAHDRAEDKGE